MLNLSRTRIRAAAGARQQGVVMMVALVILVVMTLAGIALMRSMDTTNLIAGNMAFKQSATLSGDSGVEAAIAWLEANNAGSFLDNNNPLVGYSAATPNNAGLNLGEAFWTGLAASGVCNLPIAGGVCSPTPVANESGNQISFMIQRMCANVGNRNSASCATVAGSVVSTGNNEGAGEEQLTSTGSAVYYRITVRVVGPRNAVSYIQAVISL